MAAKLPNYYYKEMHHAVYVTFERAGFSVLDLKGKSQILRGAQGVSCLYTYIFIILHSLRF